MRGLLLAIFIAGCGGGHSHDAYSTYQACFDEHTGKESLPVTQAIVVCCLDHQIGSMESPVCGDTKADCINYLTALLNQTSAGVAEVDAACTEYVTQKGM